MFSLLQYPDFQYKYTTKGGEKYAYTYGSENIQNNKGKCPVCKR